MLIYHPVSKQCHLNAVFTVKYFADESLANKKQIKMKVSTYRSIAANNMKSAWCFKFTAVLNMVHILQNK